MAWAFQGHRPVHLKGSQWGTPVHPKAALLACAMGGSRVGWERPLWLDPPPFCCSWPSLSAEGACSSTCLLVFLSRSQGRECDLFLFCVPWKPGTCGHAWHRAGPAKASVERMEGDGRMSTRSSGARAGGLDAAKCLVWRNQNTCLSADFHSPLCHHHHHPPPTSRNSCHHF